VKDEGGGLYRERGGRICHDGICVFLLCLRKRGGRDVCILGESVCLKVSCSLFGVYVDVDDEVGVMKGWIVCQGWVSTWVEARSTDIELAFPPFTFTRSFFFLRLVLLGDVVMLDDCCLPLRGRLGSSIQPAVLLAC